jgi:hypothetical protein
MHNAKPIGEGEPNAKDLTDLSSWRPGGYQQRTQTPAHMNPASTPWKRPSRVSMNESKAP